MSSTSGNRPAHQPGAIDRQCQLFWKVKAAFIEREKPFRDCTNQLQQTIRTKEGERSGTTAKYWRAANRSHFFF